ncbi:MAG: hypothetical protein J5I94_16140, partial [Phaeodactylibacter sp.]|nr:hypothetical protein [Phaeodactylibacter sp.]
NCFSGELERGFVIFVMAEGQTVICRIRPVNSSDNQVFISNDRGESWAPLLLPANTPFRGLYFNGEALIYETVHFIPPPQSEAFYLSYDRGESWTRVEEGEWPFVPNLIHAAGGVFFGRGVHGGLWRSDSLASGWDSLNLAIAPDDFVRVYYENGLLLAGNEETVHSSLDNGQTWASSSSFSTFRGASEGFWARGDSLFTLHHGDLFLSVNQGVAWTQASPLNSNFVDFLPLEGHSLLAEYQGIYRSPDLSQTLIPSHSGINGLTVEDFTLNEGGLYFFSDGKLEDASIDADGIGEGSTVLSGIILDEMVIGDGYLFINEIVGAPASVNHRISRVLPDGTTTAVWESSGGPWLASGHLKYANDTLFYFNGGWEQVYSTDYGDSWQSISELIPFSCYDYERHEDAAFAIVPDGVMRKRDGEADWAPANNGLDFDIYPFGGGFLSTRLVSTEGALFLLLGRGGSDFIEFYVSHDGGDSWLATATSLPDIILPSLNSPQGVKNVVALGGYHIMALRDVGIAVSADQGRNWTVYNDGLPTHEVNQIQVQDGRIIAGLRRHGFWELRPEDIRLRQVIGRVFFDENANGQWNAGEIPVPNVKLLLEDAEDLTFSDLEGEYRLSFIDEGAFGPVLENPNLIAVPESRHTADDGPFDFALQLNGQGPDLSVSLHTDQVHRPGFPIRFYLYYQNLANTINSATLNLDFYPELHYDSASLAPAQIDGSTLRFELGVLPPLASGVIAVDYTLHPSTPLGSEAVSTLTATLPDGDVAPANNEATLAAIVVGSYDPNDIQVDRKGLSPEEVMDEQVLRYRIRFQNTGTYPADRVVVRNAIPEELNLASIARIASSHPLAIQHEGRRELAFIFDGIQLPDSSSNEAASHGFIEYDIRVHNDLAPGDSIRNQAAIYFDFNPPIITNTAVTVVEEISSVGPVSAGQQLLLPAPNPVRAGTPIRLMAPGQSGLLLLFDQTGRLLRTAGHFDCDTDHLATQGLPPGNYWCFLKNVKGEVMTARVVVQAQ